MFCVNLNKMQQNKSNIIHLCKTVQCLFILLKQHLVVPPFAAIAVWNKMLPITGDQSFSALWCNLGPFIFAELHGYVCVCVCVCCAVVQYSNHRIIDHTFQLHLEDNFSNTAEYILAGHE